MIVTPFEPFPFMESERILLRPLQPSDEEAIYVLRTDEGVNQFLDRQRARSLEDARSFIQRIIQSVANREVIFWAIHLKKENELAGTITLWNINQDASSAEIGYELLSVHQGKEIMNEVMPAIVSFGFYRMHLEQIEACLSPGNTKSIRLLEKNGFHFTGPLNEGEFSEGTNTGLIKYKLFASEFIQ